VDHQFNIDPTSYKTADQWTVNRTQVDQHGGLLTQNRGLVDHGHDTVDQWSNTYIRLGYHWEITGRSHTADYLTSLVVQFYLGFCSKSGTVCGLLFASACDSHHRPMVNDNHWLMTIKWVIRHYNVSYLFFLSYIVAFLNFMLSCVCQLYNKEYMMMMSTYSGLNMMWCQLDLRGSADTEHG